MPRHFFNIRAEQPSVDDKGEEPPDKHAAWGEATKMAGGMRDIDGKLKP